MMSLSLNSAQMMIVLCVALILMLSVFALGSDVVVVQYLSMGVLSMFTIFGALCLFVFLWYASKPLHSTIQVLPTDPSHLLAEAEFVSMRPVREGMQTQSAGNGGSETSTTAAVDDGLSAESVPLPVTEENLPEIIETEFRPQTQQNPTGNYNVGVDAPEQVEVPPPPLFYPPAEAKARKLRAKLDRALRPAPEREFGTTAPSQMSPEDRTHAEYFWYVMSTPVILQGPENAHQFHYMLTNGAIHTYKDNTPEGRALLAKRGSAAVGPTLVDDVVPFPL